MEHGLSLGTWIAWAVIGLFLLVAAFAIARSLMLAAFLVVEPIRQVWEWVGRRWRRSGPETRGTNELQR